MATLLCYLIYAKYLFVGNDGNDLDRGFLTFFLVGICAWLWRDKIPFSKWLSLSCAIALLVASQFPPWFSVLFPVLAGYCILWVGYGPRLLLLHWTEKMDLSYGTYLYAFPVQQIVVMNAFIRHPWVIFFIATPLTLLLALLSWFLVEKRFLAMKGISLKDFDPATSRIGVKP
jgi:peptidoglycan/LPS O-acetylase OafA/YrhL